MTGMLSAESSLEAASETHRAGLYSGKENGKALVTLPQAGEQALPRGSAYEI